MRVMDVETQLALIKDHMPMTYADIQAQAAGPRGKHTFALVRRGLRGDLGCFYAIEAGHVVGTPFGQSDMPPELAVLMVGFGCKHLVMWPLLEAVEV